MRLIDADTLERVFEDWKKACENVGEIDNVHTMEEVLERVKAHPTIEAEPVKHGTWKLQCHHERLYSGEYDEEFYIVCSECGREEWNINQDDAFFGDLGKILNAFPYCHCGARMDAQEVRE